jgi:hypothetical protein
MSNKQYLNDENNYKYLTPPSSANDIEANKSSSRSKSLNRDYSFLDPTYGNTNTSSKNHKNHKQHENLGTRNGSGSSSSKNTSANQATNKHNSSYYHDDPSSCSSFTSTPHLPKPPPGNPQRISNQQAR